MKNEIKCIYCNSNKELTQSDIIPDSITTAKCLNKNVCKTCNNLTNSLYEQKFAMDFSYIRNMLGYKSRRNNKSVSYQLDIWINEKPSVRKKPTLRKTFHNLKKFYNEEVFFDSDGQISGFKNAPIKYQKMYKPDILFLYQIDYRVLFMSNSTIRTIAKIGYEWHCKLNNINSKMSGYNGIRNFILNNTKNYYVEIIEDDFFEKHTKHFFGYVEGAHSLFEYTDDKKRYIIFSLFGIVWYRVFICSEYEDSVVPNEMHQFLLDKEIKVQKSNAYSLDVFNKNNIENNAFFNPKTLKIKDIRINNTKLWEQKLTDLLTTLNLSYPEMSRLIKTIDDDNIFKSISTDYFVDLINYQEKRKIMAITILYCLDDFVYDNNKNFYENIKSMEEEMALINKDPISLYKKFFYSQNEFISFIEKLKRGRKKFETIPPSSNY